MTTLQIAQIAHKEARNPMTPTQSIPAPTTARHTPGALEVVQAVTMGGLPDNAWHIRNEYGVILATCKATHKHLHVSATEARANAHLYAAAPALLQALQKIDANAAESVEWIRRVAREAISQATTL